ncbi:MAG: hypothetical protein ABIT37_08410 [Luteolibacter sp.]
MKLSCVLSFFGLTACSTQIPLPPANGGKDPRLVLAERLRSSPKLAVLFVGNSYSFGVPKAFEKIAKEHGKSVRTGHSTNSGWSLKLHSTNAGSLKKIREGHWDIVVIQEHSEIPALPPRKRNATMFPPLRSLVTEVRESGAIPVLYQTWGRRDGDKNVRHDDFHAMTGRVREGYQAAAENCGGMVVVPAGDAWEREMEAGRGGELFMPDGSHPTPLGNAVTAGVFYETLFGK